MKNKLKELRIKNNMTQEQLAEKLYVSRQTISKWELGETNPNIEQAKEISKIFNINLDELLNQKNNNKNNIKKIIVVLILFMCVFNFFIIKSKVFMYKSVSNTSYSSIDYKTLEINHKGTDKYLQYKNVKIRNDFTDLKENIRHDNFYMLKNDDGSKMFSIQINNMLDFFRINSQLSEKDYNKILSNNHIKNSVDLLYYSLDNKSEKVNLFSSYKDNKKMMVVKSVLEYYFNINVNSNYNVYLFSGEYRGIIRANKDGAIIELIDKDISYIISVKTDKGIDYILDLISTIVIS